jgi:hypothetical protein
LEARRRKARLSTREKVDRFAIGITQVVVLLPTNVLRYADNIVSRVALIKIQKALARERWWLVERSDWQCPEFRLGELGAKRKQLDYDITNLVAVIACSTTLPAHAICLRNTCYLLCSLNRLCHCPALASSDVRCDEGELLMRMLSTFWAEDC